MPPEEDILYRGHMRDSAVQARRMLEGIDRSAFDADTALRLATVHLLQIIGEASRKVSKDFKSAQAGLPWVQIESMRHRIVHDYFDVKYDIVWQVATTELEPLVEFLSRFLPDEPPTADAF